MKLQAAYIIDEIKELVNKDLMDKYSERLKVDPNTIEKFVPIENEIEKKWAGFELDKKLLKSPPNFLPLESVIYNFFSRGIPTKCTFEIERYLLENYKIFRKQGFPDNLTDLIFSDESGDEYKSYSSLLKLIEIPILVGQLHKVFIVLCEQSVSNEIKVSSNFFDKKLLKIVVDEFNEILNAFSGLSRVPYDKRIILTSPTDAEFNLSKNLHKFNPGAKNKFSYNDPVDYKDYGKQEESINKKNEVVSIFNVRYKEVHHSLLYLLNQLFRFNGFQPGQQAILKRILLRKDVIGLLPTGGGKSLCYQLGGLLQPGITVVVDPINSLMKDQERKLYEFGINQSAFINGMLKPKERNIRLENLSQNKYLFLFISPERFHIERYRTALMDAKDNGARFHNVVIDEAHVVSEWGHDFRPSYLKLAFSINKLLSFSPNSRPAYIGLTATASFDVLADIQRELTVDENTKIQNDAIATLPPDAINRDELKFEIIDANYWKDGFENKEWYTREFALGNLKYQIIRKKLDYLVEKFNIEEKLNGNFKNGIIIFCPTKSFTLPSGVNAISRSSLFENNPSFNVVTYHGSTSDIIYEDGKVGKEAKKAEDHQEKFINNEANVMVCTKGFGMGIDKPNVRATIHYSMPPSLEAFYQEAGRAGRDRKAANCYLLYDYQDVLLNKDFLNNSFNNEEKEKTISDELCTKVKYEKGFKRNVLSKLITELVQKTFPKLIVKLGEISQSGYIPFYGKYSKIKDDRINYGSVRVSDLKYFSNFKKNCTEKEIETVEKAFFKVINEYVTGRGYSLEGYLASKFDDGIIPRMKQLESGQSASMLIGFRNDYITLLAQILEQEKKLGLDDDLALFIKLLKWERYLLRAYEFSADENDFIERLEHYSSKGENTNLKNVINSLQDRIEKAFYHIRSTNDTERAIYRLKQLGVIDDYTVDYSAMFFDVSFSHLKMDQYEDNLLNYFRRYLALEPSQNLVTKAKERKNDTNNFLPYRDAMIDFVHKEIKAKKEKSIDYMFETCNKFKTQGEEKFKVDVKYYFASKYSASQYLPEDTEDGKKSSPQIVEKYLNFINNPPNGLGGPINNFEHLKGACNRYLISQGTFENPSILILNATSTMAIDSSRAENLANYTESQSFNKALDQLFKGYKLMIKGNHGLPEIQSAFNENLEILINFNPNLADQLLEMKTAIGLILLIEKLEKVRTKIS